MQYGLSESGKFFGLVAENNDDIVTVGALAGALRDAGADISVATDAPKGVTLSIRLAPLHKGMPTRPDCEGLWMCDGAAMIVAQVLPYNKWPRNLSCRSHGSDGPWVPVSQRGAEAEWSFVCPLSGCSPADIAAAQSFISEGDSDASAP